MINLIKYGDGWIKLMVIGGIILVVLSILLIISAL